VLNISTIGAGLRLSTLMLIFLCHPGLTQQPSFSTPETSIEASDTIFRIATNSPGYLVVKEADWDKLKKVWTDSLKQNKELLLQEQKKSIARLDSIQQVLVSSNIQDSKSDITTTLTSNTSDLTIQLIGLSLGLLLIYGGIMTVRLYRLKNGHKTQIEQLDQIEKDFEQHKRSSIERERKLRRELIDTQNELEKEKSRQNQDSI
jgi:hypothetical protein